LVIEGVFVSGVVVVCINDVVNDIEEDEKLFESISSVVVEFKEESVVKMVIEEYELEESVELIVVVLVSFIVEVSVVVVGSFVVEELVFVDGSLIVELVAGALETLIVDTYAVVELSHDVTINKFKENNKKRKYLIKFIFFFHLFFHLVYKKNIFILSNNKI
jgi:hypothetical protein